MSGIEFLAWVDEHREEIMKANGLFLHGSDCCLDQLGTPKIAEYAYSSEIPHTQYDENDNITKFWVECGECSKGDIIFGSY